MCGCMASRSGCGPTSSRGWCGKWGAAGGQRRDAATASADGETITVHIPLTFRKRGGRKLVVTPDGAAWAPRPRVDNAMVKALARAFRWRGMLDTGEYATLDDLANTKGVAPSYVSRVLRLTLLAPEIVEANLDGRQPATFTLARAMEPFPVEWQGQAGKLIT